MRAHAHYTVIHAPSADPDREALRPWPASPTWPMLLSAERPLSVAADVAGEAPRLRFVMAFIGMTSPATSSKPTRRSHTRSAAVAA